MIIVSACLLGDNCKYNGGNNLSEKLVEHLRGKEIMKLCPELEAGLGVPRPPIELKDGVPYRECGECVEEPLNSAIERIKARLDGKEIEYAILKSRSPTCGASSIYDGSFTHTLIPGQGILARALTALGIKVIDSDDITGG